MSWEVEVCAVPSAVVKALVLPEPGAKGATLHDAADQDEEVDEVGRHADHADVFEHEVEDVAEINGAKVAEDGEVQLMKRTIFR